MSITIKKTITTDTEIKLTAVEVADLFWMMEDKEQCEFFNRLGEKDKLLYQMQYVTDCDILNTAGRRSMRCIGKYSPPT